MKSPTPQDIAQRLTVARLLRYTDPVGSVARYFKISREMVELCARSCAVVERVI